MAKISQRQIVAQVKPSQQQINSTVTPPDFTASSRRYFAQVSGGEVQASVEKVYDGGSSFPEALPAPIEVGDVTVTRHYDPEIDESLIARARGLVGKARYDIYIFTIDADNQVLRGRTRVYPNALLVNITEPEGDSSSGGPATFAMTFSCERVTEPPAAR
jgi:hypothetical protein